MNTFSGQEHSMTDQLMAPFTFWDTVYVTGAADSQHASWMASSQMMPRQFRLIDKCCQLVDINVGANGVCEAVPNTGVAVNPFWQAPRRTDSRVRGNQDQSANIS